MRVAALFDVLGARHTCAAALFAAGRGGLEALTGEASADDAGWPRGRWGGA